VNDLERQESWTNFRYCPGTRLQGLKKTKLNSAMIQNKTPPEHKAQALLLEPTYLMRILK
jgi:hypothetical protein